MEISMQTAKFVLWTTTIVFGLGALASILPIMMSPMMFDAPGSEKETGLWIVLWSMVAFPVLAILSIIVSWMKFRHGAYSAAVIWAFLPVLSFLGIAIGFLSMRK